MRAVIYCRVSTEDQSDNFSIPSQVSACQRYAADRGWQVVAELSDTMSGALLDRPALRQVRDLIQARAVDAVIVYSLDRLSRNVAHMLLLRDEMHAARVELHAVTRGQSADTAEGRLFDTIESAFAEFERLKIAERSKRGKRQKLENGSVVGHHQPPYGYRYEGVKRDRRMVIYEPEAAWVRRMFAWCADGASTRAIVARLEAGGAPLPDNARVPRRAGAGWARQTITRIIRNPAYRGEAWSETYQIGVIVPAIVDDDLWRRANERLERNRLEALRNAKRFYPLRTRIRCGACGAAMAGCSPRPRKDGKKYYYYRCANVSEPRHLACTQTRFYNAERLETAIWQWVVEHVLDEERLIEAIEQANARGAERRAELEQEHATWKRQVAEAESRIGRLINAYAAGVLDLDSFAAAKRQYDAQIESATRELARVEAALRSAEQCRLDRDALINRARRVKSSLALELVTPEDQAQAYEALGLSVIITGDEARVSVTLTGDAQTFRVDERRSLSAFP